jgi:hypothetical protein
VGEFATRSNKNETILYHSTRTWKSIFRAGDIITYAWKSFQVRVTPENHFQVRVMTLPAPGNGLAVKKIITSSYDLR